MSNGQTPGVDRRPMIVGLVAVVVLAGVVALVLDLSGFRRGGSGGDGLPDLPLAAATNNDREMVVPGSGNSAPGVTGPSSNGLTNQPANNQAHPFDASGGNLADPVVTSSLERNPAVSVVYRGMQPDTDGSLRVVVDLRAINANEDVRAIDLELIVEPAGLEAIGEMPTRRRMPGGGSKVVVQTTPTPDGLAVRLIVPDGIGYRVLNQPEGSSTVDETGIRYHRVKMVLVRATMKDGTVQDWPAGEASVRFRPTPR